MTAENRPSKKQRDLLSFIDSFIKGHGYGPSYREIMRALDYKSVSTVAIHVDNLIKKGFLAKRDNSARSLVVLDDGVAKPNSLPDPTTAHGANWLIEQVAGRLEEYRSAPTDDKHEQMLTLVKAMEILDLAKEAAAISARLRDKPLA